MQQLGPDSPGAPSSDCEIFLAVTYIWLEDVAKIFEVPKAQCNVNPAQVIIWLVSVTIYRTIFK